MMVPMQICIHPPQKLLKIARDICKSGGTLYIVGGSVRDCFLHKEPRDWDAEIHGIEIEHLESILKKHGATNQVGKAKGVWKIRDTKQIHTSSQSTTEEITKEIIEYDISLPLQRDGTLYSDIAHALMSRDLTINAIAYDPIKQEIIDPSDGCQDLSNKILRTPHQNNMIDDPLRAFRVCQFASRFHFDIDSELQKTILSLSNKLLENIAGARIFEEIKKIIFRSPDPYVGFYWLSKLRITHRICSEQSFDFLDSIEHIKRLHQSIENNPYLEDLRSQLQSTETLALVMGIILYPYTQEQKTLFLDRIHLHRFENYDVRTFVLLYCNPEKISILTTDCYDFQLRELADKSGLFMLFLLCYCIHGHVATRNIDRASEMIILKSPLQQLLMGRDLQKAGFVGKDIGIKLQELRQKQINGDIQTTKDALTWLYSISL